MFYTKIKMGFFSKVKSFFERKYSPYEALEYLRTNSAWFQSQSSVLQGRKPQFKNEFLAITQGKKLTESAIEEYAKKALSRVTITNVRRAQAEAIGRAKGILLAKEREKFEAQMAAAFYNQDKLVQKEIHVCGNLINSNSGSKNREVMLAFDRVKNEVRSLEHDMVKVIHRNRGINHEEAAVLRDALRKEILKWESHIKEVEKRISYHIKKALRPHFGMKAIESLQNLNQQITTSMQEFAAIERVQFNVEMVGEERKQKLKTIVKFNTLRRKKAA